MEYLVQQQAADRITKILQHFPFFCKRKYFFILVIRKFLHGGLVEMKSALPYISAYVKLEKTMNESWIMMKFYIWYHWASIFYEHHKILDMMDMHQEKKQLWLKPQMRQHKIGRYEKKKNCTVSVKEWISNFIPHFTGHVITYPCWD